MIGSGEITFLEDEEEKKRAQSEKELLSLSYGESLKKLRDILLLDKQKIETLKIADDKKEELFLVVSMLGTVLESSDKDAIVYAYTAYKFAVRNHPFAFFKREKQTAKLVEDVLNGI